LAAKANQQLDLVIVTIATHTRDLRLWGLCGKRGSDKKQDKGCCWRQLNRCGGGVQKLVNLSKEFATVWMVYTFFVMGDIATDL